MPKYIKLFENFISESIPFPFDPAKTALKGAKLHSDGLYYAIFPEGRIYIPTKETESLKKLPTNVMVTLNKNDSKANQLQKDLIALGGTLDTKANGKKAEPGGGTYFHFATVHFNLSDAKTGDETLAKISNLLSGNPSRTSGTAGTPGTSGKYQQNDRNLTDKIFGKEYADLFREKMTKALGAKAFDPNTYDPTKVVPAYIAQQRTQLHDRLLQSNPEYSKLYTDLANTAKNAKLVDLVKGTDKSGKVNQAYLDLKKKIDRIFSAQL